jgi:uncharacterized glyoxalase superfamily protein PhnB
MRPIGPASKLVPILRYRDVAAAVDWLCGAFGFKKHHVETAIDGTTLEARLMSGDDMVLLLPIRAEAGLGKSGKQVIADKQSCYIVVDDVDLHYRQAKAAGAKILDISDYEYSGRGYSCLDPEGHIWDFGSYDPWQSSHAVTVTSGVRPRTAGGLMGLRNYINPPIVIAASVAATLVGWVLLAP